MSRTAAVPIFLSVAVVLLGLCHYYVWVRTVRSTALPSRPRRAVTAFLAAAGGLVVAVSVLSRLVGRAFLGPAPAVAFLWLGFLLYAVLLLGVFDATRCLARLLGQVAGRLRLRTEGTPVAARDGTSPASSPSDPERRVFLARAVAGTALLGAGAVSSVGLHSVLADLRTPEVPVRLPRLPAALSGFRIVLLTDLHVGPILGRRFVQAVVERANALRPDLVAITGDLVDGTPDAIGSDVEPLVGLRSRHGTFFVTGNHEFYSGVQGWVESLRRLGMRVLANERVTVGDRAPGGACFDLAGTHDLRAWRFDPAFAPDLSRALAGRPPDREVVLLAHQPAQILEAHAFGVGLQLSGHTHGGQVWPLGNLVRLDQPYLSGLHRHGPVSQIYVSRGTGFWGPPLRFLAPAEITVIVLLPA